MSSLVTLLLICSLLLMGCGNAPNGSSLLANHLPTTSAPGISAPGTQPSSPPPATTPPTTAPPEPPPPTSPPPPAPPPPSPPPPAPVTGPETSWSVVTLPNQQTTPNWQNYAPADCLPDPSVCAEDHRFWEEWDFSLFSPAIDSSLDAIASQGKYQGVMLLMPLADSPAFWNNIQLMYNAAASRGLAFQTVLFPKFKYGIPNTTGADTESCYLYSANAPGTCQTVSGTSTAVAYQQLLKLMNFVQDLGGGCANDSFNRPFSIWYGWPSLPGYQVLSSFWKSLPTAPCNLQASYITWLDTGYSGAPEVGQLQAYVTSTLGQPYWVNTELYSSAQIQQWATAYAPYQTTITGYWGATTTADWALGMCAKWQTAGSPARLGFWNFFDRDVQPVELYRAYINGSMANANTICGG